MINDSSLSPTQDMFMKVAIEIFSDGKFNWGRVVALFYFACRLVIKVSSAALLLLIPKTKQSETYLLLCNYDRITKITNLNHLPHTPSLRLF